MGDPESKRSKVPSYGCSFRRLLGQRSRRRGSKRIISMGQSKSQNSGTDKLSPTTPMSPAMDNGRTEINETTTTTLLPFTPRDKVLKSRSISSLSKALRNRKWRPKRRGSISASFNMNDRDIKVEFVNVNRATEEELMTLPGVNRTLARNIVNHRMLIGGKYRRVDDLALVSGMGATKLDLIRNEICTSRRRDFSRASSKSPSLESLPSSNGSSRVYRSTGKPLLDLNKATVFDLMGVNGINQSLAAKIITRREKRGPFKHLEDLRHVGLSYSRIGALSAQLTLNQLGPDETYSLDDKISIQSQATTNTTPVRTTTNTSPFRATTNIGHRRSSSGPVGLKEVFEISLDEDVLPKSSSELCASEDMTEIFELMSLKSHRPTVARCMNHNNGRTFRIASWNLENLTMNKITNPGVLEVITRTILENELSVVAVQEICDKQALRNICDELNEPKLSRNRAWRKRRGNWAFLLHQKTVHYDKVSQQLGILYNLDEIHEVEIPKAAEAFSPIQNGNLWEFSVFKVKVSGSSWILANVLSSPLSKEKFTNGHAADHSGRNISDGIESVMKATDSTGGVLIGSFNSQYLEKSLGNLDKLANISPELGDTADNNGNGPTGSIWITSHTMPLFSGDSGRILDGLNHLAIPQNWSWGGRVTVSSPFFATFYQESQSRVAEIKKV